MSHQPDFTEPLRFPRTIDNRPALSRIRYRIGTYTDIRRALLRWLDQDDTLSAWSYRGADDPGIALLEGAAVVGDILTFYQELYANECFLRTATWRDSVGDLVRLLGYRLAPGVGGRGRFAAIARGDQPVTIPTGTALRAQLVGIDQTAVFETRDEATAYPHLSELALYRPRRSRNLVDGVSRVRVTPPTVDLARGDRLLIAASGSRPNRLDDVQIAVVDAVTRRLGETLVTLRGGLTLDSERVALRAYRIGRTFGHFGNQAPPEYATVDSHGNPEVVTVHHRRNAEMALTYLSNLDLPLDSRADDLTPGTSLICHFWAGDTMTSTEVEVCAVRTVRRVRRQSLTKGPMTAAVTVATLDGGLVFSVDGRRRKMVDIRRFEAHGVIGESFTIEAELEPYQVRGRTLYVFSTADQARPLLERSLMLVRDGAEPEEVRVSSLTIAPGAEDEPHLHELELDTEVDYADFDVDGPTATVYGNLVDAVQGESHDETAIGSGDARVEWQTFPLRQSPLTYLHSDSADPPQAPELTVYVDGRAWHRVDSFYGAGPDDEVYVVRESADGNSFVQMGDGQTGRRVPTGVRNVTALYRTGVGAHGPLRPGANVQLADRVAGVKKVVLAGETAGGQPAESAGSAREAAPLRVQSLGRIVSLADYRAEALSIAGVERALAAWRLVDNVPTVVVTVLMQSGRGAEVDEVRRLLLAADRCRGSRRHPLRVVAGSAEYAFLRLSYGIEAGRRRTDVEAAIAAALGLAGTDGAEHGLFGSARRFGERGYASRVEGVVQNVDGVRWVRVDAFGSLGVADSIDELALPPEPRVRREVVACPRDHVLRLAATDAVPALDLLLVTDPAGECSHG